MKGKKKYLPLYYKWMETGKMTERPNSRTSGGLCSSAAAGELLNLFTPDTPLFFDGQHWGYDGEIDISFRVVNTGVVMYDFTPLRQTILLFMAAMNDEL